MKMQNSTNLLALLAEILTNDTAISESNLAVSNKIKNDMIDPYSLWLDEYVQFVKLHGTLYLWPVYIKYVYYTSINNFKGIHFLTLFAY